MMTDEQRNVEKTENGADEPTIKSAAVHIGTTIESAQTEWASGVEAMELPLRLLVLGDFTPNVPPPSDWAGASPPIRVDKHNFQDMMGQLNPGLSLAVPNHLGGTPKELTVNLRFQNLKAFSPEGIAGQVGSLSTLLDIRRLASQLQNREIAPPEFERQLNQIGADAVWVQYIRQLLSPPAPAGSGAGGAVPEPQTGGNALDSLLSIVDVAGAETPSGARQETNRVDPLVHAIAQPKGGVNRSIPETIINAVDETLGAQINAILHDRAFQCLESTWRGLKFLIDRTNFRENVQVELLSVPKAHLRDAIYHQVFQPEYDDLSEYPLSVIIADYEFNSSPMDIELLGDIARLAASMQVPFISAVSHAFFGAETAEEQAKVPMLRSLFEGPKYAGWRGLRENEASQYIALTTPRFLLRFPYGPDGAPVKTFNFTERTASSADYLWGRGAFAVATTLVRSFIEKGWCTQITGQHGGGMVENLPVWAYRVAGRNVRVPLDVLFAQSKELEFVEAGFVLLNCRLNDDAACVLFAPTVYRPKKYDTPEDTKAAQLHASLPYQLFATRMADYLKRVVRAISTGLTAEQVQERLTAQFRALLAKMETKLSEKAVTVEVEASQEKPESYNVFLRLQPPFQILGQAVDLVLGLELHR
ncbi:type VI secretion system contractile sheath large subunit [Candidatus Poribacteria bacterium]|nr:type VI secretion system contractile sheath large subunit [Candidatus Poribacteria bacterium]